MRESSVRPRALFICKHRQVYGYKTGLSSGLYNSARFVSDMLREKLGIESKLVDVIDNNDIDREVHLFKPTHVFIEALWVVPEKFEVLQKLHPNVKWIIRLHSEIPFMAMEGISIDWLYKYKQFKNVSVSSNSKYAQKTLIDLLGVKVPYLPNYYPVDFNNKHKTKKHHNTISIGCFGAIRPFKNHLTQAVSAIEFSESIGKKLQFHINYERIEGWNSESILKNLRALFTNSNGHKLIEHNWMPHNEFLLLVKTMNIGMQVSFTETFNIVTADFVNNNIPVVVSDEVKWASCLFKANATSVPHIVHKLKLALILSEFDIQDLNKIGLYNFSRKSEQLWKLYLHTN